MQEDQTEQENPEQETPNQEDYISDPHRLSDVAHHEAAHAIIAVLENLHCNRIRITESQIVESQALPNGDLSGNYDGDFEIRDLIFKKLWEDLSNENCSEGTTNTAKSLIRVALAGSYAQTKLEKERRCEYEDLDRNRVSVQNDLCSHGSDIDFIIAIKTIGILNNTGDTINNSQNFAGLPLCKQNQLNTHLAEAEYAPKVIDLLNKNTIWDAVKEVARKLLNAPNLTLEQDALQDVIQSVRPLLANPQSSNNI